jgi:phenylacetate-coenzyme A ligase PaaK-like adenylate-forming protein
MRELYRLLSQFSELQFDREEYEESIGYREFLEGLTPAGLDYPITEHSIYRRLDERQVIDRWTIVNCQNAFEPLLSSSETHWQNRTSGTSGASLELLYSSRFYFYNLFETLPRILRQSSLEMASGEPHLHVYLTDNPAHAFRIHLDPRASAAMIVTLPLLSAEERDWRRAQDILANLQPHTIASKPNLFRLWLENANRPNLGRLMALISSGSQLAPGLEAELKSAFGVPILNAYITSEAGHLGTACPIGKIHMAGPHVSFKIRAADGRLHDYGRGELIVSTVLNDCMPLRNYAIGDQVDLRANGCVCGRGGPYLHEFTGRSVPMFTLPSGKNFSPTRWMGILACFPEIREFQITQKTDAVLDVLVESPHPLDSLEPRLIAFLKEGLDEMIPIRIHRAVFPVNGKLQRFRKEFV